MSWAAKRGAPTAGLGSRARVGAAQGGIYPIEMLTKPTFQQQAPTNQQVADVSFSKTC